MRNEAFATLLNQHLQRSDRSASWLARRLKVTPSTVTRWLNNETHPESLAMIVEIADALAIEVEDERQMLLRAAGYPMPAEMNAGLPGGIAPAASDREKESLSTRGLALADVTTLQPMPAPNEHAWNGSNPAEQPQKNAAAATPSAVAQQSIFRMVNMRNLVIGGIFALAATMLLMFYPPRFLWPTPVPTPLPTLAPTPLPTAAPTTPLPVVQNVITINGPVGNYINDVQNSVVIIGDSLEVQQQKARQRAALIAGEVRYYMNNVDERVALVATALREDSFGDDLATVRATVAPALQTTAAEGYRSLIANQQISALRQQFNSYPLVTSPSQPLLQLASESALDETDLRFFYQQLGEVQWASEILFEDLAQVPTEQGEAWTDYYQKRVALAVATLKNRAALAQVSGLNLLFGLQNIYPAATAELTTLIEFTPTLPTEPTSANQLLAQLATETATLQQQRVDLIAEGEQLLNQELATYEGINQALLIQPDDTWEQVVGKAISLRQLGRTREAVDAFIQYGQMFKATDATAQQYADTARQFSLQMEILGVVDGAVYIYAVEADSAAQKAGLVAGDIVIECNEQLVQTVLDLERVLTALPANELVTLTYLRLDQKGIFERNQVTLSSKPLGISFMPV